MTLPFGNPGYFASGIRLPRYLIAAGGGGGGQNTALMGSPGGAGGIRTGLLDVILPGTYPVLIGAGGLGAVGGSQATKGGGSSLGSLLSAQGGGAGRNGGAGPNAVMDGGSGAGAPNGGVYPGGTGTPGEGYNGGASAPTGGSSRGSGGGGGAGGPGGDGTSFGIGTSGPGLVSNITGSNVIYGIGGGLGSTPAGYAHGGGASPGNPSVISSGYDGRPGILILWYPGAVRSSGGVIVPLAGGVLQTFTANGTLTVF